MATTRLLTIKSGRGRSIARALKETIEYMENPLKTDGGEWVSSYECDVMTADAEFLLSKQRYAALTGREQERGGVIAYHVRQSFAPGEITPEEANRIGYETAMRFTKGKFAFIVCTHINTQCVHSHIIWNSTALDCTRKFRNFFFSAIALRRLSDQICLENGYSIIKNPGLSPGRDYGRYTNRPPSFQDRLRASIDTALEQQPATFDDFLVLLRDAGVTVDGSGKHLKFLAAPADGLPDQVKFTRCKSLKGNYTEEAIRERIAEARVHSSGGNSFDIGTGRGHSLLIDIQEKIQQGKGPGYERWAKLHNLKMMAQTLIYLQEQGLDDYDLLNKKATVASERFHSLSDKIKNFDASLTANAELQKQIVVYSKTRKTYVEYRKAGYSKKFKALHEADILLHQTAKKFFDELGYGKDKKLPTVASLREEYAVMLPEKKKAYRDYRQAKTEMQSLVMARSNVQRLLNITEGQERGHDAPTL
ncbi:MAG: relaxase/mobilization nuclease domain-containing protein [Defluviitaleaceae bacterium]|nr:relaxase/mobilization nuclease domain-containing protein [Defluviitaleaceae bacterium]